MKCNYCGKETKDHYKCDHCGKLPTMTQRPLTSKKYTPVKTTKGK